MSVAPSYQKYELIGEPFVENDKQYIYIQMPKGQKKVRWYVAAEPLKFSQKKAFGFDKGQYLIVLYGDEKTIEDWRTTLPAWTIWNNTFFGYFIPASINFTGTFPAGIQGRKVYWDEIKDENDKTDQFLKEPAWLINYIKNNLKIDNTSTISTWQGKINDWLTKNIIVLNKEETTDKFGTKFMYLMQDDAKNKYLWTTSNNTLKIQEQYNLKMKVKDHITELGEEQTIVYYCKILKE